MDKKKKAEDWLADDDFHRIKADELKDGDIAANEVQLARKILSFSKSLRIQALPSSERDRLRKRIEFSLKGTRKRNLRVVWATAAVLLISVLIYSVWSRTENPGNDIMAYVRDLKIPENGNTLLILNEDTKVPIAEENSKIDYQANGKSIRINQDRQLNTSDSTASTYHTVIVPYGRRLQMVLADGTLVWLNSGSKLVYPARFKPDKREVYLQGEAVFDVESKAGSRFLVNTNDFIVNVTGTLFNVSAYPDDVCSSAVLQRGKIELTGKDRLFPNEMKVNPGTMVVFNSRQNSFSSQQVNPDDYLSWRDGFLILHSENMMNVLKRLSRYYNMEISLEDQALAGETFTGSLDLKSSPDDVLLVISQMVPFSVQKIANKNKIIISSKK